MSSSLGRIKILLSVLDLVEKLKVSKHLTKTIAAVAAKLDEKIWTQLSPGLSRQTVLFLVVVLSSCNLFQSEYVVSTKSTLYLVLVVVCNFSVCHSILCIRIESCYFPLYYPSLPPTGCRVFAERTSSCPTPAQFSSTSLHYLTLRYNASFLSSPYLYTLI